MSTRRIHRIAGKRPNGQPRGLTWGQAMREWQRREQPFVDKAMESAKRWGKSWESVMRVATAVERGDVIWHEEAPVRISRSSRTSALDSLVAAQLATYSSGFSRHRDPRTFRPVRDFGLIVDPEYARLARMTHGPWVDPEAIQREINATDERMKDVADRMTWPYTFVAGVDNPSAPVVSDPEETVDP